MSKVQMGLVVLMALAWPMSAGAAPINVDSKVVAVTVYRGQALVTREVTLPGRAGELELVCGDLPGQVVATSVAADGGDGVKVQMVRYRTRALAAAKDKAAADREAKLHQLESKLYANTQAVAALDARAAYLDNLGAFTARTSHDALAKGGLDPRTVIELTKFLFDERQKLVDGRIALADEQRTLNEQLALLKREQADQAGLATRTAREAVIFLTKADARPGAIRLSYLVGGASWSPAYNVRLADDRKQVTVEYLAQVSQASGEDWRGVELTVSTATPAMNAMSPVLGPMWIALAEEGAQSSSLSKQAATLQGAFKYQGDISNKQYQALSRYNTRVGGDLADANWKLNLNAIEQQDMEIRLKEALVRSGAMRAAMHASADVLAVSYRLPGRLDIPSRADQQLLQIDALRLSGEAYYLAVPLLGSYVYLNVEASNDSDKPLLAGPYSAYVGGEFVGQGKLPLVARGAKCIIGFGVDTQLRCRRELIDKSDSVSWGQRTQKFEYRLRLENYKDEAVNVRLIDRIPATKDEGDIKISLGKLSDDLSEDEVYVRDDQPQGYLRWDTELAARSVGAKVRDISYKFEMKYAKNAHVGREASAMMHEAQEDLYLRAREKGF